VTIPAGTLVPRDAREFGRYELIAKLATGGMAEIYLARRQGASKREVSVLKRILPHLAEDDHFVTMFRDEAELASKLLHPNVCRVDALDHHAGTWFIEMEYLHGIALSRIMTQLAKMNKMLDPRIATGIIVQSCEGLHHAHELRDSNDQLLNVVHRDVSPPNIMLTDTGVVKLLDFGIAKARGANSKTRTGTVKGKNAYMSPEQILGRALDRRSDIFALGTVMYEMLAIKRLFQRDSDFLTFKAITEEPIPDIRERRPDLPPALRSVLVQALARDPHGRFGTAKSFGDAIRSAMAPMGGPATRSELSKFLSSDFADELSSRAEILAFANEAPSATPQLVGTEPTSRVALPGAAGAAGGGVVASPTTAAGSTATVTPGAAMPALTRPARATAPISNWPPSANLQEPVGGELPTRTPTQPTPTIEPVATSVPSMIIKDASVPVMLPPLGGNGSLGSSGSLGSLNRTGNLGDDLSLLAFEPNAGDGGTDLLAAYRRRSLLRILIVGVVLAALAAVALKWKTGASPRQPKPPPQGRPAVIVDARLAEDAGDAGEPTEPDAGLSREEIEKLSKTGRYSLDSSLPATVFINEHKIGETPLVNITLPPGKHKVRVVSEKGTRRFDIIMLGGQHTQGGTLDW
jgi:eukaryotic-like serine/threonine-protein kinase